MDGDALGHLAVGADEPSEAAPARRGRGSATGHHEDARVRVGRAQGERLGNGADAEGVAPPLSAARRTSRAPWP